MLLHRNSSHFLYERVDLKGSVLLSFKFEILERERRLHRHEQWNTSSKRKRVLWQLVSVERLFKLTDLFRAEGKHLEERQEGPYAQRMILAEPYAR